MNNLPIIRSLPAPVALGSCRLALLALAPLLSIPTAAETMIFQADRDNTMVGGGNANNNFGTAENLSAGTIGSADQVTTISFDVSGLKGRYTSITSMTLRFRQRPVGGNDFDSTVDVTNELHAISAVNRDWSEMTSTWNARKTGTAWAGSAGLGTAGTDYDSTLLASRTFTISNPPVAGEVIDFTFTGSDAELTALIDAWLVDNADNSRTNPGLLLRDPSPTYTASRNRSSFYSRDAVDPALHPRLIVEYVSDGPPDTEPPVIASFDSPASGVSGVPSNAELVFSFNEGVRKGTGQIVIRSAIDGTVVATIDVNSERVSVSGSQVTIIPDPPLPANVALSVEIGAGAFEDFSGNAFPGISDTSAWTFSTRLKLAITPNNPGSGFLLSWESWKDRLYDLYSSTNLVDWTLGEGYIQATPPANTVPVDPAEPAQFYKLDVAERPNIVVVMADDMGFSDLGCYGGEIPTPAIDRLADEGIRFSHFTNSAVCGPSRASLMTGCHAWKVGQQPGANIFADLTNNCATVMELLKDNGYLTCMVGRLDMVTVNWNDPAQLPTAADRYLGSPSGGPGNYYREEPGTPWYKDGARYGREIGDYSTDLVTAFVADFIEGTAASDQPFFVYYSHYAPHWPLHADEEDIAPLRPLYENATRANLMQARLDGLIASGIVPAGTTLLDSMLNATDTSTVPLSERFAINAAMVASIDQSVAGIMTALENAGKLDNTLILVFSDNGASDQMSFSKPVPEGVRPGSMDTFINQGATVASVNNTPFRNYKISEYEGGIATPLIAWWPRGIKNAGRLTHRPGHISDILPTCLELAGVRYPQQFRGRTLIPLDGESMVSVLRDTVPPDEAPRVLVWPTAIRQGNWKLMVNSGELYDLTTDRNESTNIAAAHPDKVAELQQLHAEMYP